MYTNLNEQLELHSHLLNINLKDTLVLKDIFHKNNLDDIKRDGNITYIDSDAFTDTYAICMFQFLMYRIDEELSS